MADFVHLHLHSEYSLLDGACRIADIPKAAKAAGHTSVAITDHGVMYGVVSFYKACKKEGIKPIIGCEVYVARGDRRKREMSPDGHSDHLVLLCKNETGYKNLIYMVSEGFITGFYSKPRVDMELIRERHEGLIALSACLGGYIPKNIVSGDIESAEKYAKEMKSIFGDDFYLEVQNHFIPEQKTVNEEIFRMSKELEIQTVATNDVHYLKKSDSENQAVLMCIQTGNCIKDGRPIGFETDEFYYKSSDEMEKLFTEHPEAIENSVKIADKCNFDFSFGETLLPSYTCPDGEDPSEYLRKLTFSGLDEKLKKGIVDFSEHSEEDYKSRIEYELSVIDKMGYSRYFLIVWDFVHYSKSKGIPVGPGRGSGAGSLVAYLIGITDIDPMHFDLLFERFLNPERVSMPDFDIDFCYNRRDEAISYVRDKYGDDHTAQIITFGTLAAKAAVRDVGRALGMSYNDVDTVAKLIPQDLDVTIADALKGKELREMYESDGDIRKLIDTSMALEGMPRHASTHAAGVVITEKPLYEYVPLSRNGGVTVTQYDMTTVAELGLLKFDFLALRYLTIIDNAEKQIKEKIPDFDITRVPLDDAPAYKLISKGNTDGVFQLESGGMKQTLTQLRPENIDDIIAAIALYRPGPMSSIPKYIEARHGGKREEYPTPILAPILDSTYGCIVYQEQVMQIFRDVAGYSLGHADVVRRAIAKKHADELMREKDSFIKGAAEHGVGAEDAEKLFSDIADFADYAFNKSHAAAYAVISYRTAYLKAHFPLEYNCALITSVLGNPAKIYEYLGECKKNSIEILPPDINRSMTAFHAEGKSIRFGLGAIKNLGTAFTDSIVTERKTGGEFRSFDDFLTRMQKKGMNKRHMEALIKAGTLDSLGVYRSRMLAVYEKLMESSTQSILDGQIDIFSSSVDVEFKAPETSFPEIPEFTLIEKLRLEREAAGMFLTGSLLDGYSRNIELLSPDSIASIIGSFAGDEPSGKYKEKDTVTVCGIITARTNKTTRSGDPMAFVTLEGTDGVIEAVVFPKVLSQYSAYLVCDRAVAFRGQISIREDEDAKLLISDVIPLSDNSEKPEFFAGMVRKPEKVCGQYKLYLKVPSLSSPEFRRVSAFIGIFRGNIPVTVFDSETQKASALSGAGIKLTEFTVNELREILGNDNVVVKQV